MDVKQTRKMTHRRNILLNDVYCAKSFNCAIMPKEFIKFEACLTCIHNYDIFFPTIKYFEEFSKKK